MCIYNGCKASDFAINIDKYSPRVVREDSVVMVGYGRGGGIKVRVEQSKQG